MKILYVLIAKFPLYSENCSDYQADCLFHGLMSLDGVQVTDFPKMAWMYKDNHLQKDKIWGKGFSLYGLINDNNNVIRDPSYVISNMKKYDYVFLCIHHTANKDDVALLTAADRVESYVGRKRIVIIDGWDQEYICKEAADKYIYFKRENYTKECEFISFAIPEEKIIHEYEFTNKIYDFAPMIPAMHSWGHNPHLDTYIYNNEEEYYQQYRDSYFAYTCKKAGWDCMRHYEIVANGCIPWFTDIEECPKSILTTFMKDKLSMYKKIPGVLPGTTVPYNPEKNTYLGDTRLIKPGEERGKIDYSVFDKANYFRLRKEMLQYCREKLTTKALAKEVLGKVCGQFVCA